MIFFCFKTKERLYREVRRRRLAEVPRTDRVDMNPAAGAAVYASEYLFYDVAVSSRVAPSHLGRGYGPLDAGAGRPLVRADERRHLSGHQAARRDGRGELFGAVGGDD